MNISDIAAKLLKNFFKYGSTKDYVTFSGKANEDFAKRGWDIYESGALQWTTRTDKKPDSILQYFLNRLPSHLMNANMTEEAATVLSDFSFLMMRLRFGSVERVLLDYFQFRDNLKQVSSDCDAYCDVICSNAHLLRHNSEDNPAYKIMLQIAAEVADDCPVTQAAERWLNPETGDSPCDWFWISKVKRFPKYCPNPCKLTIENAGNQALFLSNRDVLSWAKNNNLFIFDPKTGVRKTVLKGHTNFIGGAIELRSGDILSWSWDKTLRLWSADGTCKTVFEGHTREVTGAIELLSGDILSWSDDCVLRRWSPDGTCKAILEGSSDRIWGAIELRSGDIISWCRWDNTLRLWSADGTCKAVLDGHDESVLGAIELRSGVILSWSGDCTLRMWRPDGSCKAILDEHSTSIQSAIELSSGDILSWGYKELYLWSADGMCKAGLAGHKESVQGAIELRSGEILSWSNDHTLRIWHPNGACKAVLEGHTERVVNAIELCYGEILSWSDDHTLRIWHSNSICKAILEGHTNEIKGAVALNPDAILSYGSDSTLRFWSPSAASKAYQEEYTNEFGAIENTSKEHIYAIELGSGDILSWRWSYVDKICYTDLYLRSCDGTNKAVLKGHNNIIRGIEVLHSGDILSWSKDGTLRLWSDDGECKAVLEGHTGGVNSATELSSGDILSWSEDKTLRIWRPDGTCKAVLEGHTDSVSNVIVLHSGDILSWGGLFSLDHSLRIWSDDGTCKAVLEGHTSGIEGALELASGDILSWNKRYPNPYHPRGEITTNLRIWSVDGTCKAVLKGHNNDIDSAKALPTGEFLTMSRKYIMFNKNDFIFHLWSPDGTCKEEIDSNNPQFGSYFELFYKEQVCSQFFTKKLDWGIELQHFFNPIAKWNCAILGSQLVSPARIFVWHERFVNILQLNYGNCMSVTFKQAHQFLKGEIDKSRLVSYVPGSKKSEVPKTE